MMKGLLVPGHRPWFRTPWYPSLNCIPPMGTATSLSTPTTTISRWGELGLFGGIFHLGTVFGQLKQGVKSLLYCPADRTVRVILAAAIGAFCGILVVGGLAGYTWYLSPEPVYLRSLFGVIALRRVKLSQTRWLFRLLNPSFAVTTGPAGRFGGNPASSKHSNFSVKNCCML